MKNKYTYLIPFLMMAAIAGCSKNEAAPSSQSPQSQSAAPAATPKAAELTKAVLVDAFKRSSINSLPVFLKIADAQFEVVNTVDTTRVIKGTVTLEVLEDTFKKSRVLEFQTPSTSYRIQLLNVVKKKGDQISLPFSDRIDLANDRPNIQLPGLDDYGSEAAQFPHSYVEGSEKATKAEELIGAATDAKRKADLVDGKWQSLVRVKDSLESQDNFHSFKGCGTGPAWHIARAFSDDSFANQVFCPLMNKYDASEATQFSAYKNLIEPKLADEYSRVEKIIQDSKDKAKACDDYLLNL